LNRKSLSLFYCIGYDKEVRTLHQLAKSQEKKLDNLVAEMELITKDYTNAKTNLRKQTSLEMEENEWEDKIQKCRTDKITLQQEGKWTKKRGGKEIYFIGLAFLCIIYYIIANELRLLIDGLEISISNKAIGLPLLSSTEIIESLESSIDFTKKVTGLTIKDYEIMDGVRQYTCNQVGKLGSKYFIC
jgi:hypothetical protein